MAQACSACFTVVRMYVMTRELAPSVSPHDDHMEDPQLLFVGSSQVVACPLDQLVASFLDQQGTKDLQNIAHKANPEVCFMFISSTYFRCGLTCSRLMTVSVYQVIFTDQRLVFSLPAHSPFIISDSVEEMV